jgi:thiol-disulfide isomerase/thioredoxin
LQYEYWVLTNILAVVFSKSYCPYCKQTKKTLDDLNAEYELLELDEVCKFGQGFSYTLTVTDISQPMALLSRTPSRRSLASVPSPTSTSSSSTLVVTQTSRA